MKRNGFTLLEISIVLLIIGTVLGGALTIFTEYTKQIPYKQAEQQLRIIDEAMMNFRIKYGRLPCPATVSGNDYYGYEHGSPGACSTAIIASSSQNVGFIPAWSLGLPTEMAIDPWGSRIMYNVYKPFTAYDGLRRRSITITNISQANPGIVTTSEAHGLGAGNYIRITRVEGMTQVNDTNYLVASPVTSTTFALNTTSSTAVNTTGYTAYAAGTYGKIDQIGQYIVRNTGMTTNNLAAYVIWSSGENRHGAFPRYTNGTTVATSTRISSGSTNSFETTNCMCNSSGVTGGILQTFTQSPPIQSTSTATDNFDDIVVYRTREQLYLPWEK